MRVFDQKNIVSTCLIILVISLSASCSIISKAKKPLQNPKLEPFEVPLQGYSIYGDASVYSDKELKVSAKEIENAELPKLEAIKVLSNLNFTFVELSITNRSKEQITYKPTYTVLRTKDGDYLKPQDYTDLYQLLQKFQGNVPVEKYLGELRGIYFDREITVPSGKIVKRLLIFEPFSNPKSGLSAGITISELYIGHKASEIIFAFEIVDGSKVNP